MSNITFILFTFNDGYRLEYAIRNVMEYGEVIVSDQNSTDNTKEIVERLGVRMVLRDRVSTPFIETPEVYDPLRKVITTDWVYWGYVDNLLPKPLLEKMDELSHQRKYKLVKLPIFTYLWGDVTHTMLKAWIPCFFMKDAVDFSNNHIHSMGRFLGNPSEELVLPLEERLAIKHFSLYDLNKFLPAHLRYANEEAEHRYQQGQRFSKLRMFGSMVRYFFLFYRHAWKSGSKGLLVSLLYSFSRFLVFFRLYELENNLDVKTIESSFAEAKEVLIK